MTIGQAEFKDKKIFCKCGFVISELKMSMIVADRVNGDIEAYYKEQNGLS